MHSTLPLNRRLDSVKRSSLLHQCINFALKSFMPMFQNDDGMYTVCKQNASQWWSRPSLKRTLLLLSTFCHCVKRPNESILLFSIQNSIDILFTIDILPIDQGPLWRRSTLTKVCFDKGPLWQRSTSTMVRFDEGPLWWRSALTKVCFDKGLLWRRSALMKVHPTQSIAFQDDYRMLSWIYFVL